MQRIMEDPNRMLMPQKMILLLMTLVLAARFWTEDVWTAKKAEPEVTAYTLMRKPRVGPATLSACSWSINWYASYT